MVVKISYETEQLIEELYATQAFSTREIAKKANVVPSTVYGRTKLRERINPETGKPFKSQNEYQHYLATSRRINPETGNLFDSKSQYQDFRVRQMTNPLTRELFKSQKEYRDCLAIQRINPETGNPFESSGQLKDYLTRQRINPETGNPFKSPKEYQDFRVRKRINPETGNPFKSPKEYQYFRVRQMINPLTGKPFGSQNEYQRYRAEERQKRPKNQGLSDFIKTRLRELGKNKSWLAIQTGLTYRTVSLYVNGTSIPKDNLLERLFSSLDVPYKTLDDLLA